MGKISNFLRSDFSTFCKMYWNLILKSPGFVPCGDNLTLFVPKSSNHLVLDDCTKYIWTVSAKFSRQMAPTTWHSTSRSMTYLRVACGSAGSCVATAWQGWRRVTWSKHLSQMVYRPGMSEDEPKCTDNWSKQSQISSIWGHLTLLGPNFDILVTDCQITDYT